MPDGHGHHHVCAAPNLIQKDLVAGAEQITRVIYGALFIVAGAVICTGIGIFQVWRK
jgi:hypothetical protein